MEQARHINADVSQYLASIGRKGGQKSRRKLTSEQARTMVRVREARRAFKKYHSRCFWSSNADMHITVRHVSWVARRLKEFGDRDIWMLGRKLEDM